MLAAPELAEHPGCVGRIPRLAEQATVQDHLGVGSEHHRRPPLRADMAGDGQGLGERDGGDRLGGQRGRVLLGDVAGLDLERDAEAPQQLPAARGGRGEDEDRRAQVADYVTIRGFLSVMTRSFFSIDSRRNLGRLKQCRCALPSQ
jgi:hypothetical protein